MFEGRLAGCLKEDFPTEVEENCSQELCETRKSALE